MSAGVVLLIRHGQIVQFSPRRFVGQRDLELDATGRAQAAVVRDWLAGAPIANAFCSDLSRTRETASCILGPHPETPPTDVPDLREVHLGEWEGLTGDEVRERYPDTFARRGEDIGATRPEGGESFDDLHGRVAPAFHRIAAEADDTKGLTIVVAHYAVNRVILCDLLGLPPRDAVKLNQDYCCINRIRRDGDSLLVDSMNGYAAGPVPLQSAT